MMKKLFIFCSCLIVLAACQQEKLMKDKLILSPTATTLHFGDEYQINAISESNVSYSVKDEYHAKVSETGLVTAQFVGKTEIVVSNQSEQKIFNLTVASEYNIYPEPDVYFGQSKASIKAKFGTPATEDGDALAYSNYSSKAPILLFLFENDKLTSYSICVKTAYTSELGSFLGERYLFVTESNDIFTYINGLTFETTTKAIGSKLYNTSYWLVMYMPYNNSSNINSKNEIVVDFSKEVKTKMSTQINTMFNELIAK